VRIRLVNVMLVVVNAALLAAVGMSPGQASPDLDDKWNDNSTETYRIDNNVPEGWNGAIRFGLEQWSGLAGGRAPNFVYGGATDSTWSKPDACYGGSVVYSVPGLADGNAPHAGGVAFIGLTRACYVYEGTPSVSIRRMVGFDIGLDRDSPWYVGNDTGPNNRWDMRGIVTHEAGHASGISGHFENCVAPRTVNSNTMCNGIASGNFIGQTRWFRTLEPGDVNLMDVYR
jgi:hypothetical protein